MQVDGKPLNRKMADFRVTPGALLPLLASVFLFIPIAVLAVGREVSVLHFVGGQWIDFSGIRTGKGGFRWGGVIIIEGRIIYTKKSWYQSKVYDNEECLCPEYVRFNF